MSPMDNPLLLLPHCTDYLPTLEDLLALSDQLSDVVPTSSMQPLESATVDVFQWEETCAASYNACASHLSACTNVPCETTIGLQYSGCIGPKEPFSFVNPVHHVNPGSGIEHGDLGPSYHFNDFEESPYYNQSSSSHNVSYHASESRELQSASTLPPSTTIGVSPWQTTCFSSPSPPPPPPPSPHRAPSPDPRLLPFQPPSPHSIPSGDFHSPCPPNHSAYKSPAPYPISYALESPPLDIYKNAVVQKRERVKEDGFYEYFPSSSSSPWSSQALPSTPLPSHGFSGFYSICEGRRPLPGAIQAQLYNVIYLRKTDPCSCVLCPGGEPHIVQEPRRHLLNNHLSTHMKTKVNNRKNNVKTKKETDSGEYTSRDSLILLHWTILRMSIWDSRHISPEERGEIDSFLALYADNVPFPAHNSKMIMRGYPELWTRFQEYRMKWRVRCFCLKHNRSIPRDNLSTGGPEPRHSPQTCDSLNGLTAASWWPLPPFPKEPNDAPHPPQNGGSRFPPSKRARTS